MDKHSANNGSFQLSPSNNDSTSATGIKMKTSAEKQNLIQEFASYTTLHGFHFTLDSPYRVRRLIWLILVIGGFGLFFYQFKKNVDKLYANEVVISKTVDFSRGLPFPAVTICNQNMMRKSQIVGTIAQEYLDQLDPIKTFAGLKHKDIPSFDVGKTLQEAGHQIQSMIPGCNFAGVTCQKNNLSFIPTTPSRFLGLCYTFTANGSTALEKVGVGKRKGLELLLNAESYEYYGPFSYTATGFKIAIHEPKSYHEIDNKGYDISPGFATSIRLKRKKTIYKQSPFPSNCASKKLEKFERYTQKSCLNECWSKAVVKECGCRVIGMIFKGIEDVRFCNITEIQSCVPQAYNTLREETCECPLECEAIEYNVQMSLAYFPSETLWEPLRPMFENLTRLNFSSPEYNERIQNLARKTFSSVSIFFEDLSTDVTEEKASYTIDDFGSDLGGNMGLFLGCSLLTIFEFFDLLFMLCFNRANKPTVKAEMDTYGRENTSLENI